MTFEALKKAIGSGDVKPVYILHGEEGYYIDELLRCFENMFPEYDRDFAVTNMYAPQVADPQAIVDICRTVPMMTDRQLVTVREAQSVRADFLDKLAPYVAAPTQSTILVIASRGEKIKGKELLKAAKTGAVVFESAKVWASQIPKLINDYIASKGMKAEPKAMDMLGDYIGTNLSRLYNEIDKLVQILGPGALITPEAVERNIGISKDFNNYELVDAIASGDFAAMTRICRYFASNQKQNPYPVTVAAVFGYFADLLQAYYTPDRSERGLQQALGLRNSFAVRRILSGMKRYNPYQVIEILDAIRRYDAMSKGSGSRQDPYEMLSDLMYHIVSAPGKLPV